MRAVDIWNISDLEVCCELETTLRKKIKSLTYTQNEMSAYFLEWLKLKIVTIPSFG